MREKIEANQWWLLALLGVCAAGGGWVLTKNLLVAVGAAALAYFVISLKRAAAWPSFFLLLCMSGFGLLVTRNLGSGGKTGLVVGCIGGFLGGFVLLALLYAIKRRAGEETPTRPAETGTPAGEGPLRIETTVGGPGGLDLQTLAKVAEGNMLVQLVEAVGSLGASANEVARTKIRLLNLLGVASDEQVEASEQQRRGTRPRRRRFKIPRPGKKGIPRS